MPKLKYIGGEGAPENDELFGFKVGKFGDVIDVDADHPQWNIVSRHPWFQVVQDAPPPVDHAPPTTTPPPDVTPPVEPEPAVTEDEAANAFDEPATVEPEHIPDVPPEQPAPPTATRRRRTAAPEGSA